jgi:hypothetical protein
MGQRAWRMAQGAERAGQKAGVLFSIFFIGYSGLLWFVFGFVRFLNDVYGSPL